MTFMSRLLIPRTGLRRRGAALAALFCLALLVGTAEGTRPAAAAGGPVVAGLTITPHMVVTGGVVHVVGSATNTSSAPVQASLGVDIPAGLRATAVSGSACTPRNIVHLVYCGIQRLAPQQTATISFTVTPATAGSYAFRSYARITYTSDDTFDTETLTVG